MNIQEKQDEIIREFKNLAGWSDKYDYLIKLSRSLPRLNEAYAQEKNLIKGCQVKTWFHSSFKNGRIVYNIDSRSDFVRGVIVLLLRAYSNQPPGDVVEAEPYFVDQIGLRESFSPLQANSLWKLLNLIKTEASRCMVDAVN